MSDLSTRSVSAGRIGNGEVIDQLPTGLRKQCVLERFNLSNVHEFQDVSRDPLFDTRYLPQNCEAIQLPCFWMRRRDLYVYGSPQDCTGDEMSFLQGEGWRQQRALLAIHPTSVDRHRAFLASRGAMDAAEDGFQLWGIPTSSTRTFLAWPDGMSERACFIKTSLDSPIFGDRRLYPEKVARSVGLSKLVSESHALLPGELTCLAEPFGFSPRGARDSGMLIRSIPPQLKSNRFIAAPLFSLWGGDSQNAPLLLAMLDRTRLSPLDFAGEFLCWPFVRMWLPMALLFGILLEAHAQNLMVELYTDLSPTGRFYYRDFEGVQIDWELRRIRRLTDPQDMPYLWRWHATYASYEYPLTQLVWYKLYISLFDYVDFVIDKASEALCDWRARGLIAGSNVSADDLGILFSQCMISEIDRVFGVRFRAHHNICKCRSKFLIFLMRLRRDLLAEGAVADRLARAAVPMRSRTSA